MARNTSRERKLRRVERIQETIEETLPWKATAGCEWTTYSTGQSSRVHGKAFRTNTMACTSRLGITAMLFHSRMLSIFARMIFQGVNEKDDSFVQASQVHWRR